MFKIPSSLLVNGPATVIHIDDLRRPEPETLYCAITDCYGNVVRMMTLDDPRFVAARQFNACCGNGKTAVPVASEDAERWLAANPDNGR